MTIKNFPQEIATQARNDIANPSCPSLLLPRCYVLRNDTRIVINLPYLRKKNEER